MTTTPISFEGSIQKWVLKMPAHVPLPALLLFGFLTLGVAS